jgi:hypothetical protein
MKKARKLTGIEGLRVPIFRHESIFSSSFSDSQKLISMLREQKKTFEVRENFSVKTIIYGDRRVNFPSQFTHKSVFAMANYLEKNIESKVIDMEKIKLLNSFKHPQRYIYKEKNCLTAYQYDIKNAYTTFLRSLPLIDRNVYDKLLEFKKNGKNISPITGMALLGTKYFHYYTEGKKNSTDLENDVIMKPLSPIFNLAYYLCMATMSKLCEMFTENVISRFADSFIVNKKMDIDFLREKVLLCEIEIIARINQNLKKYHNIFLSDLFVQGNPDEDVFSGLFGFHEQQIESVVYTYDEYKRRELTFHRESKDKMSIEKITYRTNDSPEMFA